MTKFAKYENALDFAKKESAKVRGEVFLLVQTGAAEFIVMRETTYKHSVVCARIVDGLSVGLKA